MTFSVVWPIVSLILAITSSCSASLVDDFHALVALKHGFEIPEPALASWNIASGPSHVCSWIGVKCSDGQVISLDLTDLGLQGSVSGRSLSKLQKLTTLSLSGNNFTGTIEIANLTNLKGLNISNNQFSGGLDWDYSSLPNLELLDAYDNNFTALLPLGIVALNNTLRYLELAGNYFVGEIPKEYGDLSTLEYISLAGNDLHGKIPGELGNLTNLREMYLGYYNDYEGGIPAEFGRLRSLVHLDLSTCGLDGPIPRELGNLELLDTIFLHINQISGSIPRELGNLTNLVNLDLSKNVLTGEIPSEFVNLKKLKLFNLFMNKLHGSIPDYIADLPNLETLGLWTNNFTGVIPEKLGWIQKLRVLDLSSNKLTGRIPQHLCASNQLQILILMRNFLFGPIPRGLGMCGSLVRVRMGQNYLNGSIPPGFIYQAQLNLVELQNNYLSGTLKENVNISSQPVGLVELNLSNNQLSGQLPSSISNFSSVQNLLLSGNQFSGPIPPSIGSLHQVLKLDLSRNLLSGVIPSEIGNCIHLTFLDISQNNLSGSIPPAISSIRILNYLNLSRNHLNQTIPKSIGTMKSLTSADFSFNELSGKLPESGQFLVFNASSFAGNPNLCGALLNNPCNVTDVTSSRPRKGAGDFKLIFALGLLVCSLIFASAAIAKARSFRKKNSPDKWKMTAFQKLDFAVSDILECVKEGNVLGRGGAGIVYHGKMPDGTEVAVKKLQNFGTTSHDHGFQAEIQTLGSIRHRNIVRLLAFCSNKETKLLVYEYMRNGSLGEALHRKKGATLVWSLRYKIAIEAARGLCYLHHDCSPLIVHRDVKSNNILLNSGFEAHVADFGLAKFLKDSGASECMSVIAGSYGYIAPEYAYTLKVDEKSDVYSFGVVLLELLTGRRPVGEFGEGVDIVQWVRRTTNCRKEEVLLVADHRLTNVPKDEAMHLLFVAMLCVQENSVERPTMRDVVQMLSEFTRYSPDFQFSPTSLIVQSKDCTTVKQDSLV